MKGLRATSQPPEGSLDGADLSLTGLPPPVSRRPSSASAARPMIRSISATASSEPRRKVPEAVGLGGPRAINNLRRSNSATQLGATGREPPQRMRPFVPRGGSLATGPSRVALPLGHRPAEPPSLLLLSEDSPGGRRRMATSLSEASSEQEATWDVPGDQPRGLALPSDPGRSSTLEPAGGPRRKEGTVVLAPSFTANNRSNKGAVGNCVTTMVHNHHAPSERTPPPKSSNQAAPVLNNILKAASDEGHGRSDGVGPPPKNVSGSSRAGQRDAGDPMGLLKREEVTMEEAERFIHQVNKAAATIQRWYRHQVQQRRVGAARLECLLRSKREERRQRPDAGNLLDAHRQKEAARRKAREEKARQARQAAIQELQQKRARKADDAELRLPQEPRGLRALGRPQSTRELPQPQGRAAHQALSADRGSGLHTAGPGGPCLLSSSSPEPQQSPEEKPQEVPSQGVACEVLGTRGPSRSRARSRVALDELLDTLALLEGEPELQPLPWGSRKDRHAGPDEEDNASPLKADSLGRARKLSVPTSPPEKGVLLSEARLQSIVSFLDEMEKSERDRPALQPEGLEAGRGGLESASEVSAPVLRLQLEVEEEKQAMVLLQRALAQQRDLNTQRVQEAERELGRQLQREKEYHEATVQRHLSFIDQLIDDKKLLSDKCEALVAELKRRDQRCREQAARMQEQHELEMKKLKEQMSASEKVRRERWISEKTRKIKEVTVRGLEPEIQKLIARHKQELQRLRSAHEEELLRADARAAQRCLHQAEQLREQMEREKEALGQQERERAQQRFAQHLEQEQRVLEQQRRRLCSEVAAEREQLGQQAARQRAELEEWRRQLEENSSALTRALRAEFQKGKEEQEQRHQTELKALEEQLESERQAWEARRTKEEEARLLKRERELREEIRRGRDQEIELVIHRLEADMALAKEESERAAESRIKRIRDKYETELLELEQSERRLQERCAELRGRLGEAEGEHVRLQGLVRQKERELEDLRAVNEKLSSERSSLAQAIRQEFADRLAASEDEARGAQADPPGCRPARGWSWRRYTAGGLPLQRWALQHWPGAGHRVEVSRVGTPRAAPEPSVCYARVKAALTKKEEALSSLRKQHEAAVRRAEHLEELLQQQRRPLLSSK
ncbi:5-azacytidine-induced protein 1 [Tupaia chinensis]|uniref:5-azacytidine-induced protein 1 n=1 Tax=Tupaia chinensis TaxID=246437 RepID=L9KZJ7_TUPCH|nr:5-azacytidine-induced protein 1 [Tupaia chinensis]